MLKAKKIKVLFLFLFSIFSCWIHSTPIEQENKGKDFYVLTIPKSGSHLILKMLTMLTSKTHVFAGLTFPQLNAFTFVDETSNAFVDDEAIEKAFDSWKLAHQFSLAHFNFSENFHQFSLNHPEYIKIIQIRDLKDVCVSCAHMHAKQIEEEIGPCTFDEKLMFIMTLGDKPTKHAFLRIEKNARLALKQINDPNTIICRFEKLIGPNGGGNIEDQFNQIAEMANRLEIELDSLKIEWIVENLFGIANGPQIPSTFREGKVGSWREYFKEEHDKVFREIFGDLQTALGYPLAIPAGCSGIRDPLGNDVEELLHK